MGVMAGNAVPALCRAMTVFVRREKSLHINDRSLLGRQCLVVTAETEVDLRHRKKPQLIREVGVVAVHARLLIVHGTMLGDRFFREGGLVRMTGRTDPGDRIKQHGFVG